MKTIGKLKTVGVLQSLPAMETNDGSQVFHASNSRNFKCGCGTVYQRWRNSDGENINVIRCQCGVIHKRGNWYFGA